MFAFSGITRLWTSRYHGVDSLHPRKFSNSASLFLTVLIIGILDREPWLQNRVEQCKEEIFCTHQKSTAKSILFDRHFSQVQKQSASKNSRARFFKHSKKSQLASLGPGCWCVFHCTMTELCPVSTANLI